jgi:UbiD family decarboxylase
MQRGVHNGSRVGVSSLGDFIDVAAAAGEVQRIDGADLECDVGGLTELFAERKGPLLLFDRFAGYPDGFRICANALRTPRRMALALGFPPDAHPIELVRLWKERKKSLGAIPPALVADGPVLSCVQRGADVDLGAFPAPLWHSGDGGRYIGTGDMVVTRDPDGGWVNIGVYRGMIQGPDRLSLWINPQKHGRIIVEKYWQRGQAAPVAVVLGCDPLTWMTASMSPPFGSSEYELAGAYRSAPVEVVELPHTRLPVPAHAEIVIEGEIPPLSEESAYEGPFGEWPGYYSHQGDEPVVRIANIYHRPNPILLGMAPLRPLGDGSPVGIPTITVQLWEHLERSGVTDVAGVWAFGNQLLIVCALRQRYAGHAKQALMAMSGFRHGDMKRYFVTVDDDIDPANLEEVIWAISTRADPATSIDIVRGGWAGGVDPLLSPEQRRTGDMTIGRMLIDACKPWTWRDAFPRSNVFSPAERRAIEERWHDLLASAGTTKRPPP